LREHWPLSVMLSVGKKALENRLIRRWLKYGFPKPQARAKARHNELPNATRCLENSVPADMTVWH